MDVRPWLACAVILLVNLLGSCDPEPLPQDLSGSCITMTVTSDFFRPALALKQAAILYVDWGDGGGESSYAAVAGDYFFDRHSFASTAQSHMVTLRVEPWSALSVLNLGFRAGDGGNNISQTDVPVISLYPPSSAYDGVNDYDVLDAQRVLDYVGTVTSVSNIQVATSLQALCCERQPITELDCSGMSGLLSIEGFFSGIQSTNFQGCSELRRCCLESTGADSSWRMVNGNRVDSSALDLRDSKLLQDIRGTGDDHDLLILHPDALKNLWHLCKMANSRMTMIQIGDEQPAKLDLTRFSALTQCWISFSPVVEELKLTNNTTYSFWLRKTGLQAVDISGQTQVQELELTENELTSVNVSGCTGLNQLRLDYCSLSTTLLDQILADLDALGTQGSSWGGFYLADTNDTAETRRNAAPSASGLSHVNNLRARGWTVTINE